MSIHIVKDPPLTAATVATVRARIALALGMIGLSAALAARLVLFILARVFRHGAAMRDDLEGTV